MRIFRKPKEFDEFRTVLSVGKFWQLASWRPTAFGVGMTRERRVDIFCHQEYFFFENDRKFFTVLSFLFKLHELRTANNDLRPNYTLLNHLGQMVNITPVKD